MLLSVGEEQQIYNLVNNKATGLSKEPPILKYDYNKIGAWYQAQVLAET